MTLPLTARQLSFNYALGYKFDFIMSGVSRDILETLGV